MKTPNALTLLAFSIGSVVLAGAAGCSKQDAPPAGQGAVPVTVATLKPETVTLTRELPGRVSPFLVAEVRPQVNGIIARRLYTEGGLVQAGQPLYQIEDATYRADNESARASLARAEATLVTTQLNARRSAELVKIDAVSKQDDEDAAAALRQAEADVKATRAAVDRASVVLGYARITAPISGRIGKSTVTQGALVTANQTAALATIQQLDPVYVDVTQSSAELLELRRALAAGTLKGTRDLPVTVLLEDGTRFDHDGKLAFSDVTVDPSTGSFSLRVVVPNPDHVLLPGMYVRAVIGDGEREKALLVPQQGITHDPKGNSTAMVVVGDGKVELRAVKVSRAIGDKWLVEDGLVAGDRVIVEGLQRARPGAPVQATEAGAAPAAAAVAPQPQS
ncbi:MAG: efflux RND transporter periplasmic adaptor subunit [Proteobacteria bacterium]|nr:efflux RND transporter periplasmic adaptor subunit [Pseudomonadota bacterium]MBP6107232.1 efflux RND transporter periplasmic adaptor subunit [Steroidobacteraceae bacterium]MBP7014200.1 efflux RND transporter periplasmic adaptor subunit [Steroidobacteraceae bacterium]